MQRVRVSFESRNREGLTIVRAERFEQPPQAGDVVLAYCPLDEQQAQATVERVLDAAAHALSPVLPKRLVRWICDRYEAKLTGERP